MVKRGGGNLRAMGCIATDLRGGGPLDVSVCATPTLGGPLRGVQPLTCGGAVPCTQAAVAVDLRGGGPLYAGGGRTPRKGGGWCWRVPPLSLLFLNRVVR